MRKERRKKKTKKKKTAIILRGEEKAPAQRIPDFAMTGHYFQLQAIDSAK